MSPKSASLLHDIGIYILRYFVVALAFIPWGILYAFLVLTGWEHWSLLAIVLGGGFVTSHFAWRTFDKRQAARDAQISAVEWNAGIVIVGETMWSKGDDRVVYLGDPFISGVTIRLDGSPSVFFDAQSSPSSLAVWQSAALGSVIPTYHLNAA